ncbi:Carboxylesterase CarE-14 [Operophtera brumata]|uniref:Carboxylesterase CarE-14 n=1 Tax=Operophtera brumata TaxID=104452 RepID=A0A0L7KMN7_OPEBR|nr:Carboxylesterase CarE-14 [Operophtera brumata]
MPSAKNSTLMLVAIRFPETDDFEGSSARAPNPPPSFSNTFMANRKDIKCVRALGAGYEGTEDCLVVNVFTPTIDNTRQLSVMVWVKGKEFDQVNDHELYFGNFVEKDVVVVSLNYRESILGFLCLGTETAPGNAGLKDIIAGLRWVKENIAQFGGNPNDITLVGHGSGAAAVDLVTMSPMAIGLVNKAIAQSGNALSPWAVSRDNLEYAVQVAEALGHVITNIEDLSEIFRRTSVAALMGVINDLDLTDNSLAFAPCLERESLEGAEPFLIKSPYEILQNGEFLRIPFMIGYVDNEGTIRSEEAIEDDWLSRMDESFNEFLQPDLQFATLTQQTEVAQRIRARYFENNPIDMDHIDNYIAYHGDTMILVSALREVRLRVMASNSPVYVYQFSYKGSLGESFVGPLSVNGAAHSEELAYMFFDANDNQISDRDLAVGDIIIERWTNFAKSDNEIIDEATLEVHVQNPHPVTMTFWDDIYADHFLDAEGIWEWTERDEDEDDGTGEGSGEGVEEGSGEGIEEGSGDGIEEGSEEGSGEDIDGDEDEATDSASSAVGYTFSIITLFAVLNKFHCSQMLS